MVPLLGISYTNHIVHSMVVPLASMMPISSWVGVEVSYLESQKEISASFLTLLESIAYRTFPILLIYTNVYLT